MTSNLTRPCQSLKQQTKAQRIVRVTADPQEVPLRVHRLWELSHHIFLLTQPTVNHLTELTCFTKTHRVFFSCPATKQYPVCVTCYNQGIVFKKLVQLWAEQQGNCHPSPSASLCMWSHDSHRRRRHLLHLTTCYHSVKKIFFFFLKTQRCLNVDVYSELTYQSPSLELRWVYVHLKRRLLAIQCLPLQTVHVSVS